MQDHFLEHIKTWLSSTPTKFIWGTCAGLILLADRLEKGKEGGQCKIGGVAITATRNSFGRQRESCEQVVRLHQPQLRQCLQGLENEDFPGIFIRAPGIASVDDPDKVTTLATKDNGEVVAVWQDNFIVTSFHPELTGDLRFHQFFLDIITNAEKNPVF
jgi:5'-phosphate synthase pdxT subunit